MKPSWTLVGGAALVGFHLPHRETRDLDLFWRERRTFEDEPSEVERRLRATGLDVTTLQRSPSFVRLRVADDRETVVVDLVADSATALVADERCAVGDAVIHVAAAYQVFVSKLCALLGRAEARDLVDVRALLRSGADLSRGLADAPRIDAGFSPLTLAWVLRGIEPAGWGQATGLSESELAELAAFRDQLVADLLELARRDLED
jgi:hypothetical protein